MKKILDVLRTPSGRALPLWRAVGTRMGPTLAAALALFALLVMLATTASPPAWAQAQPNAEFDHLQTGFPLTERHAKARCESCHQNAIFKGTPRDCASCHREGMRLARGNVVMPAKHLPTQQACDACHTTRTFAGARFNHSGIAPGSCLSCHNGGAATGKPPGHLATAASCESCHRSTSTWLAVSGGHTAANAVGTGTCDTCHNGVGARGKTPKHIPVPAGVAKCDACHRSQASFTVAVRTDHSVLTTMACTTCHNGTSATGKPPTHVATTATCETCHKSTANWSSVTGPHTAANAIGTGTCDTCHNGTAAKGKSPTHLTVPAGVKCDACHGSQTSFTASVKTNHSAVVTAACSSCHNGTAAKGKTPTHVSTTATCDSCHKSTTTWLGASAHTAANAVGTGTCDTCHNGTAAKGKSPTHILVPAGVKCDACHGSQSSFTTAVKTNHSAVATAACSSCHNGTSAKGKPPTHVATTATCDSCHKSTTTWLGAGAHTAANAVGTGTCDTCHNGTAAKGKSPTHIPVPAGVKCDACHGSQASFTTSVKTNHSAVATAACSTCHNGTAAKGKPLTHVATTATCDSCHKSTTTWLGAGAHTAANAVGTGTCDTCHNGTAAKGKHAGHVPLTGSTGKCDSCHKSQASFTTAVTMNHTVVPTAECKTCHNGQYLAEGTTGALAKPANHIPEAQLLGGTLLDCKSCHTSNTSWLTQRMNHNNSQGNGAGWCKGCHESTVRYGGTMERKTLRHEAKTGAVVTDCSQSGCHRPLGSRGTPYTKW